MDSRITTFAIAFAASLSLTAVVRAVARRWRIVDYPDGKRKLHAAPVPLWGGVAVYLAVVLGLTAAGWGSFAAGSQQAELSMALIVAAGIVCVFGGIDDSWVLSGRLKLLLQVCAVLPIVALGYSVDRIVAFGYPIQLGWFGVPLTVAWLVGCINALNLLDGMDGLASTVGLLTAVMMAIIATSMGNGHVAVIALVLAGALAGFLIYNLPPASIFLGDSGSMVIGLILGVLGIQGALKTSATLAITVPAVIMSLPMFDMLLAVVRRKLTGKRLDAADREHVHHRLLDRGLTQWQALCIIGALCLTTGAATTAATIFRFDALAWITALALMVLAIRLEVFGHHELALAKRAVARRLAALAGHFREPDPLLGLVDPPTRQPQGSYPGQTLPVLDGKLPPGAQRPVVDVGVIYTHEHDLMPRLLSTLKKAAGDLRMRLILVDNASAEGVGPWKGYFGDTVVISNRRRMSYSANLNRILQASSARYVLMLNTDMFFDPEENCLAKMVAFMERNPDCGISGCRLYHADGQHAPSARRFQTISTILARRFGLGRFMQRTLGEYFYRRHPIHQSWECDWLSGCFMMARREAVQEVGPFDVRFGKYFEDVDMCLRMARAGWTVMYNGQTYCYHLEQRASKSLFSADARRHARAYLRWLMKWGFSPGRAVSRRPQRRRAA